MRQHRAFTLIELLVVVTIIVLLLSILLPSMGRAITVANRAVCASNLHQFGTANISYAADNLGAVMTMNYQWGRYYPVYIRKDTTVDTQFMGEWSVNGIGPYTSTFNMSNRDTNGIAMCPEIDADTMNRYIDVRNFGYNHTFLELQYVYYGGADKVGPAYANNGADKLAMGSRIGGSGQVWMSDILYFDGSDANLPLGPWRFNHGPAGWAFNEYSWMPNQPGNVPNTDGMNRLFGDGSARWKDITDFNHVDLMSQPGVYPDPKIGIQNGGGDTFYF